MDFLHYYYLNIISGAILGFTGIIGNILVIIIYSTEKLRGYAMSRYLVILAISDIFELISSIFMNLTTVWKISGLFCQFITFFVTMFFQYCSNIILIVSIDRVVSVKYVKQFNMKNKLKFQLQLAFAALLLTLPISITYSMYYYNVSIVNGTNYCDFSDPTVGIYVSTTILLTSTLIPFIVLIVCSIIIWRVINGLKKKLSKIESKKELQLFRTMIGMDLFFFICNTPVCTYLLIVTISPSLYNVLIFSILNLISMCHNTFSFFVYFFANKVFREQFWTIILKRKSI
jgi:hypothetical protein